MISMVWIIFNFYPICNDEIPGNGICLYDVYVPCLELMCVVFIRIRMIPPESMLRGWCKKLPQEADRRILLDHRVEAVLKQATSCHSGWPLLGMVGKKNPIFNESLDIQMPPLWGLTFKEPQKNHTKKLTLPMEVFGYLEVVHLKWEWNFSYPTASQGTGIFILHFTI